MAEPSLSVSYSDLQSYVAIAMGWPRDASNDWDTDQTSDFALILKKGLRKFYFPPPLKEGEPRHEWSFLQMVGRVELSASESDYSLPDDFSGVIVDNSVSYNSGSSKRRISKLPEGKIAALQGKTSETGDPVYYCVRPKGHTATTGMRWEIVFYPTPDAVAGVRFRYPINPPTLTSTNQYPLGGTSHSEVIIEAVLAAAEEFLDDDAQGVHQAKFLELLGSSIRQDREIK
jgi:hypothetical protein